MNIQNEHWTNYFGLLQISAQNNKSKECFGLFTNPYKLVTSKNCFAGFEIDLTSDKTSGNFSLSVLFGMKKISKKIDLIEKYEVVKIVPVC